MTLLQTIGLTARCGDFQALFGVDIALTMGQTVEIIGANGTGKTTLTRSIAGVLRNAPEQVMFDGRALGALPANQITGRGVVMIPEGRRLFPSFSVEENLLIAAYGRQVAGPWELGVVCGLLPILRDRRRTPGTALSGGPTADGHHRAGGDV
jgi:branched-chain amino acid transport system ATP-binding protein